MEERREELLRAAIYARASVEDRELSVDAQVRLCKAEV